MNLIDLIDLIRSDLICSAHFHVRYDIIVNWPRSSHGKDMFPRLKSHYHDRFSKHIRTANPPKHNLSKLSSISHPCLSPTTLNTPPTKANANASKMVQPGSSEQPSERADAEQSIKRNPHGDFSKVQASRPDWDSARSGFLFTKTRNPEWQLGDGATDGGESLRKEHVGIEPYEEGRPAVNNYKLLISAIVPRPVGFLSTRSEDGECALVGRRGSCVYGRKLMVFLGSSTNLSPFSYTQMFNHDPPIFCIGFSGGFDNAKDTLKNLAESKECKPFPVIHPPPLLTMYPLTPNKAP